MHTQAGHTFSLGTEPIDPETLGDPSMPFHLELTHGDLVPGG